MKLLLKLSLACMACFTTILPGKCELLTLSRQQCVEIALRDNPTVRIANMEIKKVNYAKKETLASLFPSIDFSAAYQRSIELQTIRMNMGGVHLSPSSTMGAAHAHHHTELFIWTLGI